RALPEAGDTASLPTRPPWCLFRRAQGYPRLPRLPQNAPMPSTRNIHDRRLADAWATLKSHADQGLPLDPDASRLAFADPEFLLRRETRGIRFQLELLKPDLEQQAHGIENTIVVFGSARFRDTEGSAAMQKTAEAGGDEALVRRARALAR